MKKYFSELIWYGMGADKMQGFNLIVVFNETADKMLMCKRKKNPYKGLSNFVGGKIEAGEDGFAAAYRELFEETGITKEDISLTHLMDFTYHLDSCYVETYMGRLNKHVEVIGDENTLYWENLDKDFFDPKQYAGEGNIGHIMMHVDMERVKALQEGCHSFLNKKKAEMGADSEEYKTFEPLFIRDFNAGIEKDKQDNDRTVLIESERLLIRKAHISDSDFMSDVESNPDNSPWVANWPLGWRVARFGDDDFLQVIVERKDGIPIGFIIFRDMLKKEECVQLKRIAIIDKGKGYGKEILRMAQKMAFEIWNTKRLYLSTKEANLRAQSIYKATGFVPDMPDPCTCFHMDREDYERIIYNR